MKAHAFGPFSGYFAALVRWEMAVLDHEVRWLGDD